MRGILTGLGVTFSTFLRKPVTVEYPDQKHALPVRARSFPVLTWDFDHDEPFCTGCNICVRNCPVDCMTAVMRDNPKYAEGTSNRRKIIEKFWIDYARCMRCNICVEVCPFEAIVMDNNWTGHEHAAYDRRDLHMDIEDLLAPSKSGKLTQPFRPLDSIEALEKAAKGEEPAGPPGAARPHCPGPRPGHPGARTGGAEGRRSRGRRRCRRRRRSRNPLRIEDSRQAHARRTRSEGLRGSRRGSASGTDRHDRDVPEYEAGGGGAGWRGFCGWRWWHR
jgi:NADH-quinone oxidoreductase subunit I